MAAQDFRHLFDLPDDVTYLNIASQSPFFKSVYNAGLEGLDQKRYAHTITTTDYFEPVEELKMLFAKLIDTPEPERIANIPSVSYGIASIANNINLKESDEIILIEEQFPSNVYTWQRLANKHNASIKMVKAPDQKKNRIPQWNENILNAITDNTAVVSMGNIHWSNGSLFDLRAIREKTRQHNALLIIDGSQSVGAFPFSVKEIDPDALVVAGYKWLFGPYGCAYAYFGSYFDNGIPIEENWINRLHSENFAGLTSYQKEYKPLANRYSAGEGGSFIYVKMQIAALKQLLEWSPEDIQNHCKLITKNTVSNLLDIGCFIEPNNDRTHHLFGVELPKNINLNKLKQNLIKNNIYISFRGNYIRLSSHYYNTEEDFERLYNCIADLV